MPREVAGSRLPLWSERIRENKNASVLLAFEVL